MSSIVQKLANIELDKWKDFEILTPIHDDMILKDGALASPVRPSTYESLSSERAGSDRIGRRSSETWGMMYKYLEAHNDSSSDQVQDSGVEQQ